MSEQAAQVEVPVIRPYCIYKGQPVYSREAVRTLLRKSDVTIWRYVQLNKIGYIRIGEDGTDLGFTQKHVDDYLAGIPPAKRGKK